METQELKEGIEAIVEGSNLDDNGDYRPGLQAVAELGVKSPLRVCGLDKKDIRILSKKLGRLLHACHPDLSMEKPFQKKNCPW